MRTDDRARSAGPASMADVQPQSSTQTAQDPALSEGEEAAVDILLEGLDRDAEANVVGAGVRRAGFTFATSI